MTGFQDLRTHKYADLDTTEDMLVVPVKDVALKSKALKDVALNSFVYRESDYTQRICFQDRLRNGDMYPATYINSSSDKDNRLKAYDNYRNKSYSYVCVDYSLKPSVQCEKVTQQGSALIEVYTGMTDTEFRAGINRMAPIFYNCFVEPLSKKVDLLQTLFVGEDKGPLSYYLDRPQGSRTWTHGYMREIEDVANNLGLQAIALEQTVPECSSRSYIATVYSPREYINYELMLNQDSWIYYVYEYTPEMLNGPATALKECVMEIVISSTRYYVLYNTLTIYQDELNTFATELAHRVQIMRKSMENKENG